MVFTRVETGEVVDCRVRRKLFTIVTVDEVADVAVSAFKALRTDVAAVAALFCNVLDKDLTTEADPCAEDCKILLNCLNRVETGLVEDCSVFRMFRVPVASGAVVDWIVLTALLNTVDTVFALDCRVLKNCFARITLAAGLVEFSSDLITLFERVTTEATLFCNIRLLLLNTVATALLEPSSVRNSCFTVESTATGPVAAANVLVIFFNTVDNPTAAPCNKRDMDFVAVVTVLLVLCSVLKNCFAVNKVEIEFAVDDNDLRIDLLIFAVEADVD